MDKKVTSFIVLSLIFVNTLNVSYATETNQQYIQIHHANQKYLQEQKESRKNEKKLRENMSVNNNLKN